MSDLSEPPQGLHPKGNPNAPRLELVVSEQSSERANQAVPEIIRRYASGESTLTIARDLGVSRAILYRWLLAGVGDEQYAELVTHCLVQRVAEADLALESARGPVEVARAREQARFARMDLERRRPGLYGAKPEVLAPTAIVVLTRME